MSDYVVIVTDQVLPELAEQPTRYVSVPQPPEQALGLVRVLLDLARAAHRARAVAPCPRRRQAHRPARGPAMTATATRPVTAGQLRAYLQLLAGPDPAGRLIEIRYTTAPERDEPPVHPRRSPRPGPRA